MKVKNENGIEIIYRCKICGLEPPNKKRVQRCRHKEEKIDFP